MTQPMNCEEVSFDMMALLDGALDAFRVEAVHGHFAVCDRCARFYQSLRAQLVLHRWSMDAVFDLDAVDDCQPEDVPDYHSLAARLRGADLGQMGRLLYEILKAEFLSDYGDDLEAAEKPISDLDAERHRGSEMVEELRDWHDADQVDGVDLADVAKRLAARSLTRLDELVEGMEVVAKANPSLTWPARYYQAIAHLKARREAEAERLLSEIATLGPAALMRPAQVCLATLPVMLRGRADEAIVRLNACLAQAPGDAVVLYNLAKAHFLAAGEQMDDLAKDYLARARALDAALVEAHLRHERGFRQAALV